MRTGTLILIAAFVAAIGAVFLIAVPTWERPPHSQELGYSAANLVQFTQPGQVNPLDRPPPPVQVSDAQTAGATYKNITPQLHAAMIQWVAPSQGCGFCHAGNDYASDANPRKEVALRMLAMTREINADWKDHVGDVGVTCYTCHRGQPMPPKAWFLDGPLPATGILGAPSEFKETAHTVRDFFPNDGWEHYLLEDNPIRVESRTAAPTGDTASYVEAVRIYEMMMQMSDGMGVNCTYCHTSVSFQDWNDSPPARWTALSGFKMTRHLNQAYVWPLRNVMPQAKVEINRAGPPIWPAREMGAKDGNGLVNCSTCHVGSPKPMGGANMVKDYPELVGHPAQVAEAATAPGPAGAKADDRFLARYAAEAR
jgi:photosynthetic reaction center cytochrome c subunit